MIVVGIAQSTFAIILVAVLFGLFVLLLLGSFARSRRAAQTLAVTGEGARPAVPTAATRGPRAKPVMSRRDFFRGGLLASLGIFAAQFGGATIAFLWPNLKGGFGSTITLTDSPESIPKEMMRVGWMRTMVSSNRSFRALPPSATTAAVPRISIMRGCQGGSTSSITMLARPVRCTSRSFLVWLIRMPPTSIASCSAL